MARKAIELNEEKIIGDYLNKGMTQNEIAKNYGVNVTYIRKILRKNNIDTRLNSKTHEDIEEKIYAQILEYKKISEISENLNVTRDVVRRVADNHGIDIVQYRNAYYEKEIISRLKVGKTYVEIVDELPVSLDFVKRTIKKYSIDTPMEKKAKKVRELLDKGYGIVKISKELKMSTRTIHKIINAQN